MKTLDEVIKFLNGCKDLFKVACVNDQIEEAISILELYKQSQDNPPLTWDELKDIAQDDENWKREPVWLELYEIDGVCFEPRWAILNDWMDMCYEPDYKNDGECIECLTAYTNTIIFKEDIGVLWNAYRRKPDKDNNVPCKK